MKGVMATKKVAGAPPSGLPKKKFLAEWVEMEVLGQHAGPNGVESVFLPWSEGYLTYKPGATDISFSGYASGTTSPVAGVFSNANDLLKIFERKPAGRPKTAFARDVAVLLAYRLFEFFYPKEGVENIRRRVVKAWKGHLPEFGFTTHYLGITGNDHVKRSMNNAMRLAPELASPVRTIKNLPLFKWNENLSGSLIQLSGTCGKDWLMVFYPSPAGQIGEPQLRDGREGIWFSDATVWAWRVGEEYAGKGTGQQWRPKDGCIRVVPD